MSRRQYATQQKGTNEIDSSQNPSRVSNEARRVRHPGESATALASPKASSVRCSQFAFRPIGFRS
jgi:hypothetical protein